MLARAVLKKFGGDSVEETKRNVQSYLEYVDTRLDWSAEASDVADGEVADGEIR